MEQNYLSQFRHHQLHSVRKHSFKPWKKPIAPLPSVPSRVYKVGPESFKQVVQELTAEPGYRTRRLKSLAPPKLSLSTHVTAPSQPEKEMTLELLPPPGVTPTWSDIYKKLMSDGNIEIQLPCKQIDSLAGFSPLGLGLTPTSYGWCSLPLMSPGTLSSLEQRVL